MRHGARDHGTTWWCEGAVEGQRANSDLLVTPLDFRIVVYSSKRQQLY